MDDDDRGPAPTGFVGGAIPEAARRAATPRAVREWVVQVSQQLARDERRQQEFVAGQLLAHLLHPLAHGLRRRGAPGRLWDRSSHETRGRRSSMVVVVHRFVPGRGRVSALSSKSFSQALLS